MADLADLLLEFAPSDDIAGVCEGLARAVVRCANSGFAAVVAAAAEDGSFDAYGDSGAPWRFLANVQGTFNRARQSGDPAQRAYTELTAVYVSDVQTDEECRAGFAATSAAFGVRSVFAVPLLADGSCVGVAAAYFSEAGAIDDATLGAFRILAAHGGVAIAPADSSGSKERPSNSTRLWPKPPKVFARSTTGWRSYCGTVRPSGSPA